MTIHLPFRTDTHTFQPGLWLPNHQTRHQHRYLRLIAATALLITGSSTWASSQPTSGSSSCSYSQTYYGNTCWWNNQFLPWYQNDYLLVPNPDFDTLTSTVANFFTGLTTVYGTLDYKLDSGGTTGFTSTYFLPDSNNNGFSGSLASFYPNIQDYNNKSMTGDVVTALSNATLSTTFPYSDSADDSSDATQYMYLCSKHKVVIKSILSTLGASQSDDYGDSYYASNSDACNAMTDFVNDFGSASSAFSDDTLYDSGLITAASNLSALTVDSNCPDNIDTNDAKSDLNNFQGSLEPFCTALKPYYFSELNNTIQNNNADSLGSLFGAYSYSTLRNPVAYQASSTFDGNTCTTKSSTTSDTSMEAFKYLYALSGLTSNINAMIVPQIPIADDQVLVRGSFESMSTASDNGDISASKLTDMTNFRNNQLSSITSMQNNLSNSIAVYAAGMSIPLTVLGDLYKERSLTVTDSQTNEVCTQAELNERNANWRLQNPSEDGSWMNNLTAMNEVQLLREVAITQAILLYQGQQQHRDLEDIKALLALLAVNSMKETSTGVSTLQQQIESSIAEYVAGQSSLGSSTASDAQSGSIDTSSLS